MAIRRLLGFNLLTALALAAGGVFLGHWLGEQITGSSITTINGDTGENDVALSLSYVVAILGFFIGLGAFNYPVARMLGRRPSVPRPDPSGGIWRYFRYSHDHKVVGWQYFVVVGIFFALGGLNAMLIRLELLHPQDNFWAPDKYLGLVGLHGATMMGTMTSAVLGPFANYFVPLLIGARRSAFPRLEALSLWLLVAAQIVFPTTLLFQFFQTGWTGYSPLAEEGTSGIDAYIFFFILVALSMTVLAFSLLATIVTQRAPGLTWGRLPIFVWSIVATAGTMVLAAPVLAVSLALLLLDRTAQTSFFAPTEGGHQFLFENLFWFFGHPEVYLLMLPGAGLLLQMIPVFVRKPLWGYRLAVAGMLGVAIISFTVWQHHLFVSGLASDVRPFFILSTETISVPTGFIFVCAIGTIWRGRMRLEVPMLFCLAWLFNFAIGGLTGVFLSDAPSDTTLHGSFFVMAHFHYTIMGALVFVFFGAIYYWIPKMTGLEMNRALSKLHFWLMFLAFNSTFFPLFIVGAIGMPRRYVTYPSGWTIENEWASISAFVLGFSMLIFLFNLVWSMLIVRKPSVDNPWHASSLEWQTATPPAPHNFDEIPTVHGFPHDYGVVPEGA